MMADDFDLLLASIELAGVTLTLAESGDALRFNAPPGVMTAESTALIVAHKPALIRQRTRMAWGRDPESDGLPHAETGSDGLVRDVNAPNLRRLVYCQARELGFIAVDVIEAGQDAWVTFCRDGDEESVIEMGLILDDVLAVFDRQHASDGRAAA
jgi:hypothetical protein